jgi:uncharacterized delta-60 repeat protein
MSRPILASLFGLAFTVTILAGLPLTGQAAPPAGAGDLDASFGSGGKVTTDFAGSEDVAQAIAIQPNGRIVIAGHSCSVASCDFALARYLPDGTLDGGFGAGGSVTTDFGGSYDAARALALQADGKIVLAGFRCLGGTTGCPTGSDLDFALARYNPDGSLDATFGIGGKVTTDFSGASDDRAFGVALQADGRIVAAGRTCSGPTCVFALARYGGGGSLDATFGSGGLVTTDFSGSVDEAFAVVIQPIDGKIVAAGGSGSGDFALARYDTSGSLDGSFGAGGQVTTDFAGSSDIAFALALQSDGRVVAAGRAQVPISQGVDVDFAVARYDADGSLDAGFGTAGTLTTGFAAHSFDVGRGVAIQGDGKVVVAGFSQRQGKDPDFALARYGTDGNLDKDFGKKGKVTTDFANGSFDGAAAVAIQGDGRIVAVGSSQQIQPLAPPDFGLARYLGP